MAVLTVLAAVLALAAPCFAFYPTPTKLHVTMIDGGKINGETDAGQLVECSFRSTAGAVKAIGRTVVDGSGIFSLDLGFAPIYQPLAAGDTIEIMLGDNPSWVYSTVYSHLAFTGFNLGTGTITGNVTPRQNRIFFAIAGYRVVPAPVVVAKSAGALWKTGPTGRKTGPTGAFAFTPALTSPDWSGTFRRNDQYEASYSTFPVPGDANFSFKIGTFGVVPGLYMSLIDTNLSVLAGPNGLTYNARLLSKTGGTKGTSAGTITGVFGPISYLAFTTPTGRPAALRSGDSIQIAGTGGFSTRVPLLKGIIHPATNSVTVLGSPKSFIEVAFSLFDDNGEEITPGPPTVWVKTNALGRATVTPGGPDPLRERDKVSLTHLDKTGHRWYVINQARPAP